MFGSPKNKPASIRFFCETCGAEVPREARQCPECGKFFASVRCPACGFVGDEAAFKGGCPGCGYSVGNPPPGKAEKDVPEKRAAAGLPLWIYLLTAAAFTGVLAALFFTFFA